MYHKMLDDLMLFWKIDTLCFRRTVSNMYNIHYFSNNSYFLFKDNGRWTSKHLFTTVSPLNPLLMKSQMCVYVFRQFPHFHFAYSIHVFLTQLSKMNITQFLKLAYPRDGKYSRTTAWHLDSPLRRSQLLLLSHHL